MSNTNECSHQTREVANKPCSCVSEAQATQTVKQMLEQGPVSKQIGSPALNAVTTRFVLLLRTMSASWIGALVAAVVTLR